MSYNFWQLRVWGLKSLMRVNSRAASHNRFRSSPYYFATKENPSLQFFIDVHCLVGDAWGPLFVPGPNSSVQSPFAVPAPLPCTFKKPLRTTHQCAFAPACEHLHFYKTLLTSTWWHVIQSLRWLFKAIFCTWPARVCSRCHASSFSSKLTGCTSPWRTTLWRSRRRVRRIWRRRTWCAPSLRSRRWREWRPSMRCLDPAPWRTSWSSSTGMDSAASMRSRWVCSGQMGPPLRVTLCVCISACFFKCTVYTFNTRSVEKTQTQSDSSIWFHLTKRPHISILSKLCNFLFYGLAEIRDRNCQWQLLHKR